MSLVIFFYRCALMISWQVLILLLLSEQGAAVCEDWCLSEHCRSATQEVHIDHCVKEVLCDIADCNTCVDCSDAEEPSRIRWLLIEGGVVA